MSDIRTDTAPAAADPGPQKMGWGRRLIFIAPTLVFVVLLGFFLKQLGEDPSQLPSVLIDRPVPAFALDPLPGRGMALSSEDLKGDVSLVNIFGSWCVACQVEHPYLMKIKESGYVAIHGIDWREKDPMDGKRWLEKYGDPYTRVGLDPDSRVAVDFGVTGAPETFVVDKTGVIRYKHIGPVTDEVFEKTLKPLIEELRKS
ncbi:DsbE family thiol:disulfide interchange protein [Caenispirillum bisanense]|uniref:Cytochrome c biogenesis protein CcmG, thiol:disulfide interchange protein DsbE n=1 Tax=Caenispirillum bisanense TaxID=414052 RepID=A0A286GBP6_9PROT|nr:cytochrome c biogenesis protein CcmG, thiol:disulfide interchange protein DsbE [Caenispirillum bisanense]